MKPELVCHWASSRKLRFCSSSISVHHDDRNQRLNNAGMVEGMLTTVYSLYGPVMKLSLHFLHFLHFHHLSCAFCPATLLQTASVHPPGTRLGVLQVPCTGTRTDIVNTQAAKAAQTAGRLKNGNGSTASNHIA